jgi:hypothetical protein
LPTLRAASEDAEDIAQIIEKYGDFKVERMPVTIQNNKYRVDPSPSSQNSVTVEKLKNEIVQLLNPNGDHIPDKALFFFSGHGVRDDTQEGYLTTTDTNLEDKWGISLTWLRELLKDSPIRRQIIWLDCCHSGEILSFDDLEPKNKGYDRCFIAASRNYEYAYEKIEGDHGVLTDAILRGLDPFRQPDGIVTNLTLVDYVDRALRNVIQEPLFNHVGQSIVITRKPANRSHSNNLLLYLPNRVQQEIVLAKAIQTHNDVYSPLLCLIHGNEEQCSDMFLERLRRESLPDIIPEQAHLGIDLEPIFCDTFQDSKELHHNMLASLGKTFIGNVCSTRDEVAQAIAQRQCPLILYVSMSTQDWKLDNKINIFQWFTDFWNTWQSSPRQKYLLLVCLSFHYHDEPTKKRALLKRFLREKSVNQQIREAVINLNLENPNLKPLPELLSIGKTHVEQWAGQYINKDCHHNLKPHIRELFKPPDKKIAMEPLAHQLKLILKTHCDMRF